LRPRALYFDCLRYQPENLTLLFRCFDLVVLPTPDSATPDVLAGVHVLFAPLGWRVDAVRIGQCPSLRAIVSNTTGIPHIDLEAAKRRDIAICALHDEQEFLKRITPTAEHTIGLLMAAWRRIPSAHAAVLEGQWDRRLWGAPRMLSRLRLGIVGYGRLGRMVATVAAALGMDVQYYDPHQPGSVPDLLSLASRSDVLSLHAPATAETVGLVSREVLLALPRGAVVVNTARGELIDTDALLDLLESGHLHAAGLDTIDGEFDSGFSARLNRSRLLEYARTHDNLILTPHIGGSTVDAWFETERRVILKCCEALGVERPQ
jgi:D-3-phosphoglycerate dehydrogenase